MPIVGGLDIHRKQITFDYLDTVTGEVRARPGRPGRPGAPAGLAGPVRRLGRCRVRGGGVRRVAVCRRGAGRGRDRRASWRAGRHRGAARAASGTPRPTRPTPGTCGRCWPRPAARMLDPAGADPGVPGAAGDLSRPAPRAHRLGAAHPRGVLPPGRPTAGRGSVAHRAGPGRAAGGRGRASVPGRAAAGRHRPGHARRHRSPAGPAAPPAAGCRSAPDRRQGAGGAAVWGRPPHRAGADLLAGRQGPVLLLPQSGPVHRAGHHRALLRPQRTPGAAVPAGTAGAALGGV